MTTKQKEDAAFMKGAAMAYKDCADLMRDGAEIYDEFIFLSKILRRYASAMYKKGLHGTRKTKKRR